MSMYRILTCISLDSKRWRKLLCRIKKAAADPVEEVDGVLLTKLRGSTVTPSAGTSYLASGMLCVPFCLPRRKQHHTKLTTRINNAHAPARRPTSSALISVPMVLAADELGRDLAVVETAKDLEMLFDLCNLEISLVLRVEIIPLNFKCYYGNKQYFFPVHFVIKEYYWLLTDSFCFLIATPGLSLPLFLS